MACINSNKKRPFVGNVDEGRGLRSLKADVPLAYTVMAKTTRKEQVDAQYIDKVVGMRNLQMGSDNLRKYGLTCQENSMDNFVQGAIDTVLYAGLDGKYYLASPVGAPGMTADFQIREDPDELYDKLYRLVAPANFKRFREAHSTALFDQETKSGVTSTLGGIKDVIKNIGGMVSILAGGEKINGGEIANLGSDILGKLTSSSEEDFKSARGFCFPLWKPVPGDPSHAKGFGVVRGCYKFTVNNYKDKKSEKHSYSQHIEKYTATFSSQETIVSLFEDLGLGRSRSGGP